ncbi:MAG TPA: DUF448 domain-containing protein [Sulfurovum sp.]|nr:DUF448 domain-containing protein [Sulfurovum sp.]
MKKSQPIRMCITCRNRHPQNTLIRLRLSAKEVVAYDGTGRSFYLCNDCVNNEKKIKGLTKRFKQEKECFLKLLKELMNNG